jgi:ubiquinone/menaquinone biosynthesis C-methylase UbiE
MEPKLQRRIQRYGWDLAADAYEPAWAAQLSVTHAALLSGAALQPGEQVLDVACGTGLVTFAAAAAVSPGGSVMGVDISGGMVATCARRADGWDAWAPRFRRMDAEALDLADASFDAALCSLGLMYLPDPERALAEMRRILRPGGRASLAVWGPREACAWSPVFEIIDAEVESEVCPLFFRLGAGSTLAEACRGAGFAEVREQRIPTLLGYADAEAACTAAFEGGPMALAWSRFDARTRARARASYVERIAPHRHGEAYALPGEFVVVTAFRPKAT